MADRKKSQNINLPVQARFWKPGQKEETREHASAASAEKPLSLPDKPSISVLPFDIMSSDPE